MTSNPEQQQSSTSSPSRVWFQLVDFATGLPYKGNSATSVSLPPGSDVNMFRDAVKAEYDQPNYLRDIPSGALVVFKNEDAFEKRNAAVDDGKKEPLKSSHSLDGLGSSEKDALVVAFQPQEPSNFSNISVPDKLRRLGVEFSSRDITYLLKYDPARYSILMSPYSSSWDAQRIIDHAQSKIKTDTRNSIAKQHSFFFNASLNVDQGQTASSLYYAFSESGEVFVAKVYNGNKGSFLREVEASQAFDHKNLVKFVKTFSIQSEKRHIIIMPFFPRSVADWLDHDPELPLAAIKIITRSCFDALCYLHSKGFCFADLKPANIMLRNSEPSYAVLVDYGATVRLGTSIIESSESYFLDANMNTATERLDWICLGTTIAQIAGFDIFDFQIISDLVDEGCRSDKNEDLKNLIVSCLVGPSSSTIESALKQLELST